MSCSEIPVITDSPFATSPPPKDTPMDRPSGKLWMVMAMTKSQMRASASASLPSWPVTKCSCGRVAFSQATKPAPSAMPAPATSAALTIEP